MEHSALYAVMGDDGAAGTIEINDDSGDGVSRRHRASSVGTSCKDLPLFDAQVKTLAGLTESTGGRVIPNPVWKLLPAELTWLLKDKRGPLTTVHPLGGCAMGDTSATGVVDNIGRVFSRNASSDVHDGLVVLDGSIIPTALGTNPALTISAVALRAAEALATDWGYAVGPSPRSRRAADPALLPFDRCGRSAAVNRSGNHRATCRTSEFRTEWRAGADAHRRTDAAVSARRCSRSSRLAIVAVLALLVATDTADFKVRSSIRIFPVIEWEQLRKNWTPPRLLEQKLDAIADFSAPLTGSLRIFERQNSCGLGRIWRAGKAWILNRGLRDTYQAIIDGDGGPGLWSRIKSGIAIASRSGEIRAFVYDLTVGPPDAGAKIALDRQQHSRHQDLHL